MAICNSGMDKIVRSANVTISVAKNHPLVRLAKVIPWLKLEKIVMQDLKDTTEKGFWWLGRKLKLRIHLAAYILQQLYIYNRTDRQIEYAIKDNAAYQLFCGRFIVAKWHCPDHTKIEEFRSRLSPETQRIIANEISAVAVSLGFADPRKLDIDSTVQEANMAFPSDAQLLVKLTVITKKVAGYLINKGKHLLDDKTKQFFKKHKVNIRLIRRKLRNHFFTCRYADDSYFAQMQKHDTMFILWWAVVQEASPIWLKLKQIHNTIINEIPWNIRKALNQIGGYAGTYMLQVWLFLDKELPVRWPLCFHLDTQIACFNKGKLSRK